MAYGEGEGAGAAGGEGGVDDEGVAGGVGKAVVGGEGFGGDKDTAGGLDGNVLDVDSKVESLCVEESESAKAETVRK